MRLKTFLRSSWRISSAIL
ncbi:unnamed protein product [Linum tenue]|uniref:Uncharacterized protein n=1 Tax=Linum tenue TaxID=586396 RepID=A0AAV0MKN9_9ROSI|nr:unnamed protein product [Linum tenue]